MTKERQEPLLGVRFNDVSILRRCIFDCLGFTRYKMYKASNLKINVLCFLFCFLNRQRKSSTEDRNSDLCIGQEITILCKVQKRSVPLHMFVPVKMELYPIAYHLYFKGF